VWGGERERDRESIYVCVSVCECVNKIIYGSAQPTSNWKGHNEIKTWGWVIMRKYIVGSKCFCYLLWWWHFAVMMLTLSSIEGDVSYCLCLAHPNCGQTFYIASLLGASVLVSATIDHIYSYGLCVVPLRGRRNSSFRNYWFSSLLTCLCSTVCLSTHASPCPCFGIRFYPAAGFRLIVTRLLR